MRKFSTILLLLACAQASFGQLSGAISGALGPGTYHVIGTIRVNSGDSLRLMPATTFIFDGPYPFKIYGTLLAEGTEADSIVFTTEQSDTNRWRGLRFSGSASSGSRLAHCLIENGYVFEPDGYGGGVYCYSSSPTFTNCTVSENSASDNGGGVYCHSSSPTFTNCTFSANSAAWGGGVFCYESSPTFTICTFSANSASDNGGGVYCYSSSPTFANCTVTANSARYGDGLSCYRSSPTFTNCSIIDNGDGVYCDDSSPTFTNCTVSGNAGDGVHCYSSSPNFTNCSIIDNGGGLLCYYSSSPTFTNCAVSGNSAARGGGVYCSSSSPTFTNCTVSGNSASGDGGGVYCNYNSSPTFNSTIIAFSTGSGIYFYNSEESHIEYCDIFGNSGGNFDFYNDNSSNGPPGIGQLVTTNVNGDSCDVYFNIFRNPMFVDTSVANYHLMWTECDDAFDSPCIDAGDPSILDDSLDCDFGLGDSLCDIGRYGGNTTPPSGVLYPDHPMIPTSVVLYQNYPNPFNASTMIRYDVPAASKVSLTIFNLLGQEVARLVDGRLLAGTYTIAWNAGNFPSGVYLCRMETPGFVQTRKLVLVK